VDSSLAWVFGLIDADESRRHAALSRHRELLDASNAALRQVNEIWAQIGSFAPNSPPYRAFREFRNRTLFGPISAGDARYGVLFLQWEARYPDEWREASRWTWSHWGTKESVLRRFATAGVPGILKADVAELVLDAIQRPYRCKDWWYARLVPHVADPAFLDRLSQLTDARAQFLLHVAANPEQPITRNSFRLYRVRR
jgi:hypothetical protein